MQHGKSACPEQHHLSSSFSLPQNHRSLANGGDEVMHGMRKISGHFGTDDEELAQLVLAPPEALAVVSAKQS